MLSIVAILALSSTVLAHTPACEINGDGICDAADIDAMTQMVMDGNRTLDDRNSLIKGLLPDGFYTYIGDSNLDGVFDEGDLIEAFVAGTYLSGGPAGWVAGDWSGDLRFDEGDLIAAFIDGGYLQGPRPAQPVPEPSTASLLLFAVTTFAGLHRYRRRHR